MSRNGTVVDRGANLVHRPSSPAWTEYARAEDGQTLQGKGHEP